MKSRRKPISGYAKRFVKRALKAIETRTFNGLEGISSERYTVAVDKWIARIKHPDLRNYVRSKARESTAGYNPDYIGKWRIDPEDGSEHYLRERPKFDPKKLDLARMVGFGNGIERVVWTGPVVEVGRIRNVFGAVGYTKDGHFKPGLAGFISDPCAIPSYDWHIDSYELKEHAIFEAQILVQNRVNREQSKPELATVLRAVDDQNYVQPERPAPDKRLPGTEELKKFGLSLTDFLNGILRRAGVPESGKPKEKRLEKSRSKSPDIWD